MAVEKKHKCPDGLPEWLLTFGDLMSLLLTFFVLIVSFSTVQEAKFKSAIESFKGQLGIDKDVKVLRRIFLETPASVRPAVFNPLLDSTGPSATKEEDVFFPDSEVSRKQEAILREISSDFKQKIKDRDDITVTEITRGLAIAIKSPLLFESGSAQLRADARSVLNLVTEILAPIDNAVQIEGYTDDVPVQNDLYASNWELSTARAQSVLGYFQFEKNYDPARLSVAGYGEYHPFVSNDTPEQRAQNRIVRIVVIRKGYE